MSNILIPVPYPAFYPVSCIMSNMQGPVRYVQPSRAPSSLYTNIHKYQVGGGALFHK